MCVCVRACVRMGVGGWGGCVGVWVGGCVCVGGWVGVDVGACVV